MSVNTIVIFDVLDFKENLFIKKLFLKVANNTVWLILLQLLK